MEMDNWKVVVFSADCPPCSLCEEPVCVVCEVHYADCDCPGPTMDEYEYDIRDGTLMARRTNDE